MNFNVVHIRSFFGRQRRFEFGFVAAPVSRRLWFEAYAASKLRPKYVRLGPFSQPQ
jgi:hypothetical protein